jgi:hypothetical protein
MARTSSSANTHVPAVGGHEKLCVYGYNEQSKKDTVTYNGTHVLTCQYTQASSKRARKNACVYGYNGQRKVIGKDA